MVPSGRAGSVESLQLSARSRHLRVVRFPSRHGDGTRSAPRCRIADVCAPRAWFEAGVALGQGRTSGRCWPRRRSGRSCGAVAGVSVVRTDFLLPRKRAILPGRHGVTAFSLRNTITAGSFVRRRRSTGPSTFPNANCTRSLPSACAGADASRVNDLSRFMTECRLAGLPTPRTHVVALRGRTESLTGVAPEALPSRDLFLRPGRWTGSTSGQHWRWNRQSNAWKYRGQSQPAAGLLAHVARLADSQPWVLHEAITNHPDICRFAAGGICTAQIATGLGQDGRPHVLFAALHLPASVDAGWGPAPGELVAGIDVANGRLGVALDEFASDGEFSVHPGTGMTIADAVVPQWSAFCDLALRAHQRFGEFPFVRWRIALSGSGPLLVEAGTDWGVFRHVWPARTRFAMSCLQRLTASAAPCGTGVLIGALPPSASFLQPTGRARKSVLHRAAWHCG